MHRRDAADADDDGYGGGGGTRPAQCVQQYGERALFCSFFPLLQSSCSTVEAGKIFFTVPPTTRAPYHRVGDDAAALTTSFRRTIVCVVVKRYTLIFMVDIQ